MTRLTRVGGLASTRRATLCPVGNPSGAVEFTFETDLYSSTNTANAPYDLDSLNQGSGTSTFARSNAKAYAGSWSLNAAMSTYGLVGFNNIEYVRSLPTQITLSCWVLNNATYVPTIKIFIEAGDASASIYSAGTTPNSTTWTEVSMTITNAGDIASVFSKDPGLSDPRDKFCWTAVVGCASVYQTTSPVNVYFDNFFVTYTY
jgi:hypothetical protein